MGKRLLQCERGMDIIKEYESRGEDVKKYWFGALAALMLCGAAAWWAAEHTVQRLPTGMFSWEDAVLDPAGRPELLNQLRRLQVGALYQTFSDAAMVEAYAAGFLTDLERAGIAVYYLTGQAQWGLEADGAALKAEIDRAAALSGRLAGLMVDVEPYLTDEWDRDPGGVMARYVDGMAAARAYAQTQGLPLIACIPYWYDNDHLPELERLIRTGCDGVAVMNYYRSGEADHIRTEVELARAAGIPVISISEFQRPGTHDLTERTTYYTDGLSAARDSWTQLAQALGEEGLSFAYHWYGPVLELLERDS